MFKFGFSEENSIKDVNNTENETISWFSSKEIFPIDIPSDVSDTVEFACNDVHLKQVSASSVLNLLENKGTELAVINANQNHSDLLTAIYEGGLKVWECTIDLINYLNLNEINFSGKKVLDLGCGAGLVGIFTLSKGSICYFQDYNEEVVQYVTIPNVKLNVKDISSCKFFSGDWQSFTELLTEKSQFDYILTSETIYNTKNYDKLHNVFKQLLKKNGTIYLAAKSYYFGVGGSVSQFQDFLIKNDTFDSNYCWKCTEGVQREILQIKFKE